MKLCNGWWIQKLKSKKEGEKDYHKWICDYFYGMDEKRNMTNFYRTEGVIYMSGTHIPFTFFHPLFLIFVKIRARNE